MNDKDSVLEIILKLERKDIFFLQDNIEQVSLEKMKRKIIDRLVRNGHL
ncbi:MAG: hypothetical protein JW891_16400 [Candidatus Lokiarchaeota archaeon]|nr:hypothetical protein [Candidatus Lokiarchaeota archaeon]